MGTIRPYLIAISVRATDEILTMPSLAIVAIWGVNQQTDQVVRIVSKAWETLTKDVGLILGSGPSVGDI